MSIDRALGIASLLVFGNAGITIAFVENLNWPMVLGFSMIMGAVLLIRQSINCGVKE